MTEAIIYYKCPKHEEMQNLKVENMNSVISTVCTRFILFIVTAARN